ncbi:hypothetical protein PoB_004342800 [Plakobranchus ocellatus]|uniref:Uncharacterized protein n=1 Tax=Plakobranchus ocellatus TaxID=259542 RepID=A0AAV4BCJ9_9GAST|nr:hypothetical protein PoB_004342800 [Plakobranchus ocellatus]
MAATCLGSFGSYKLQYSRYLKDRLEKEKANPPEVQTVWITKRYAPTDERVLAPVPRHKHVVPRQVRSLRDGEDHWIPASDPPLASFNRCPPNHLYISHCASRCEDWSTLRQMLPPYATVVRVGQPRWGVTQAPPPTPSARLPPRFPHINSCMTNYVDEMALTNRQFKHC